MLIIKIGEFHGVLFRVSLSAVWSEVAKDYFYHVLHLVGMSLSAMGAVATVLFASNFSCLEMEACLMPGAIIATLRLTCNSLTTGQSMCSANTKYAFFVLL